MPQACVEQGAALSNILQKAAALAELSLFPASEPCQGSLVTISLSEAGNAEEVANLGGRFLPVPPTLLAVGVANQTPRLAPYSSALLHLHLLFFLKDSGTEAEKFNVALIGVLQNERVGGKNIFGARYRMGKG